MDDIPPQINANTGRFLDQFRACIRAENKAYSTEKTYLFWCKRFILFHNKRHPKEMGSRQIEAFLNHLAINRHVSPSTQKTALNALIYMYRRFLKIDLPALNFKYAKVSQRIPRGYLGQPAFFFPSKPGVLSLNKNCRHPQKLIVDIHKKLDFNFYVTL